MQEGCLGCKHVMVSLREVTLTTFIYLYANSQNLRKKKSLKTEKPTMVFKDDDCLIYDIDLIKKLYSGYVNCLNYIYISLSVWFISHRFFKLIRVADGKDVQLIEKRKTLS